MRAAVLVTPRVMVGLRLRERLPCGRLRGVGVAGAALGESTSGSAQQQAEGKQDSHHSSHRYPPLPRDSFHR